MEPTKEEGSQTPSFQEIVRKERVLRRWSQADVAEKIGSDPKTVGRWERGLTFPSPHMSQRLSEIYGKSIQELGLVPNDIASVAKDMPESEDTAASPTTVNTIAHIQNKPEKNETTRLPAIWQRYRWQLAFIVLFLVAILLVATGTWKTLLVRSNPPMLRVTPTTSSNPYTNKGVLALNDVLIANTAASWSLSTNDEGQCFFVDDAYRIKAIKPGGYMKLCLAQATYFRNSVYEVKMQVVSGDCGGITFRAQFPQFYYFLVCQDGNYRFVRYDRDSLSNRRIITSGVSSLIHRGLNVVNKLAVVANGDTFALYINQILLYQGADSTYLDGQIGLLAHPCSIVYLDARPDVCSTPVEVAFNDARVWKM
jgi:transcriptional regulator with XRE-family HTH domain